MAKGRMRRHHATFIGFIAILLWSLLALLTVGSAPVPPFQLSAICFTIAGLIGLIWVGLTGRFSTLRQVSGKVVLFGTAGLFGYHALYFAALRHAPPAEAGLIAYLWPLLIVLFSGLLPGEILRPGHFIGALISFVGAALLISDGGFAGNGTFGYVLAAFCAVTWAGYSVLSRRLRDVPSSSITLYCLVSAVLSLLTHIAIEETVWPAESLGWLAVFALGLGPVGLAFFVWDIGVKNGDIQLLGVASYAAPLLSTLCLILAGIAVPTWTLLIAALFITGGAAIAAWASARAQS